MNKQNKLLKKIFMRSDIINIVLGAAFIISLVIVFLNPYNKIAILTASTSGGLMNAMLGVNMIKDPKKKATGMSYIMMGIIMVALGFFIMNYVNK